jgi:hypothetical protein
MTQPMNLKDLIRRLQEIQACNVKSTPVFITVAGEHGRASSEITRVYTEVGDDWVVTVAIA